MPTSRLNSTTSAYKIYRWDNEAAVPTVAFSGGTAAARLGDSIDVIGSGANTRIIAGHNSAGFNNFSIFTSADGLAYTGSSVAIGTDPPASLSFRLGITFTDSDTVVGRGEANNTQVVDIDAGLTSATLVASNTLDGSTLRAHGYRSGWRKAVVGSFGDRWSEWRGNGIETVCLRCDRPQQPDPVGREEQHSV